jgi:hypothetical protein
MRRRASDIEPTLPQWLWPGRIPLSEITLIAGEGGTGKSTLAVMIASRLSTGELTGNPEGALLALQEDHESAVTVPRLMVAGADRNLIHPWDKQLRLPRDLDRLEDRIVDTRCKLLVIDPLDATVPSLASQKSRETLDELAQLASAYEIAVVGLHHLTKSGRTFQQRLGGGRVVWNVPRSILGLSKPDPIARLMLDLSDDGPDVVVLSHHKSNYGRLSEPLLLDLVLEPHPIPGGEPLPRLIESDIEIPDGIDQELVASDRPRGWRRRMARVLIERFLLRGPSTSEDLLADALALDISQETFERARGELANEGVIETYQHDGRHWWRLSVPDRLPEGFK